MCCRSGGVTLGTLTALELQPTRTYTRRPRRGGWAALALGACLATSPAAAERGVRKGPWVMDPTPTAMTLLIERSSPGPVTVRAWQLVPSGSRAPDAVERTDEADTELHEVRLTSLVPGARYQYEVRGPGMDAVRGTFGTPSEYSDAFRFLLYGDTRTNARSHGAVVRAMQREGADFVVHTGDLVHDGRNESHWQQFFQIEGPLLRDSVFIPVVGNHELRANSPQGIANFRRYVHASDESPRPELDYTIRYGNVRMVLANAYDNWSSPRMRGWLEGELRQARREGPEDFLLVVTHWGLHSSGPHGDNPTFRAARLGDLFRQYRVDLVVAGHDHIYERGEDHGLKYIVTGGSGAPLYDQEREHRFAEVFARQHHYVRVDAEYNKLTLTAVRPDGTVLDRFVIRHADARAHARPRRAAVFAPVVDDETVPPPPVVPRLRVTRSCLCAAPGLHVSPRGSAWSVLVAMGLSLVARRRVRAAAA